MPITIKHLSRENWREIQTSRVNHLKGYSLKPKVNATPKNRAHDILNIINILSTDAQAELYALYRLGNSRYYDDFDENDWNSLVSSFKMVRFRKILTNVDKFQQSISSGISNAIRLNVSKLQQQENPQQMLLQLAEFTCHPYWRAAVNSMKTVKVTPIRPNSEFSRTIDKFDPSFNPTPGNCYFNCLRLSEKLKSTSISYVEGITFADDIFSSHAWVEYKGKYYDPTLNKFVSDTFMSTQMVYLEFFRCDYSTIINAIGSRSTSDLSTKTIILPPAPFAQYVWQTPEEYSENLNVGLLNIEYMLYEFALRAGSIFIAR